MTTVTTTTGKQIDFDAALGLMDFELCEMLHNETDYETEQEFYAAYCAAHIAKYGTQFEPDKDNPVW